MNSLCALFGLLALAFAGAFPTAAAARQIVFAPEFDGRDLYVLDLDTGSLTKRRLDASIEDLTYSRALKTLAFDGVRKGASRKSLFLLRWPGGNLEELPPEPSVKAAPYRPQIEPHGQYLYAVDYRATIARYSLVSHAWARVPVDGVSDLHAQGIAFSPSGRLAAISPGGFGSFLIAEVSGERFRVKRKVLADFESCISPHWLDEGHLVFLGRKAPGLQFVWVIDLSTNEVRQLSAPPVGARDFMSLSGDSKEVAFTATDKDVGWTIWRLRLDKPTPEKLLKAIKDDSFLFPAWID